MSSTFAANYSSPPTTVFSGTVDIPKSTGNGTPTSFNFCIDFKTPYTHPADTNLIVEVINRSTTSLGDFRDYCLGDSGCTSTRVFAIGQDAPTGNVWTSQGYVIQLTGTPAVPPPPITVGVRTVEVFGRRNSHNKLEKRLPANQDVSSGYGLFVGGVEASLSVTCPHRPTTGRGRSRLGRAGRCPPAVRRCLGDRRHRSDPGSAARRGPGRRRRARCRSKGEPRATAVPGRDLPYTSLNSLRVRGPPPGARWSRTPRVGRGHRSRRSA